MFCERHDREVHVETDLVLTAVGPNRTAVMAALRGPMMLSPTGVGEIVRAGVPIVVGLVDEPGGLDRAVEEHLKLCGATTERWNRLFCWQAWPGDPVDDGAIA